MCDLHPPKNGIALCQVSRFFDVLHLAPSYGAGLVAVFRDRVALDLYTVHPEHVKVADFGRNISEHVAFVPLSLDLALMTRRPWPVLRQRFGHLATLLVELAAKYGASLLPRLPIPTA